MSINTTSDYTLTRNRLIELSLSRIGVTEPQNDDYSVSVDLLNLLVRQLDSRGTWLWTINNTESSVTTIANQSEYTSGVGINNINPSVLKIVSANYGSGNDRIFVDAYDKLSSVRSNLIGASAGSPEGIYFSKGNTRANNKLIVYPKPNGAFQINYTYRRALYDFVNANDNPDFPQSAFQFLMKQLAFELCPHYSKPLQERQLLKAEADEEFLIMERDNSDVGPSPPLRTRFF